MRTSTRPFPGLLAALVLGFLAVLLVPVPAHATAAVVSPTTYASTGDVISGWGWLRGRGDTATWTFTRRSLGSFRAGSVHLNVSALVTNRVSGGSGFSAPGVVFQVTSGRQRQVVVLTLVNPYRPIDPAFSRGVGYAAYGASTAALKAALFTTGQPIVVRVAYPFPSGRHVAFKKSSLTLGLSR